MTQTRKAAPKEDVERMFDSIASHYDFLNHFLSLGIDKYWRRQVIKKLRPYKPGYILDIATGTADLSITAAKLQPKKIIGIDIAARMLELGRIKIQHKKLEHLIMLQQADSEKLPFNDEDFDAAMVAFGVRNFENLQKGLVEIRRVIKNDAPLLVLEFSHPRVFPVKQLYLFYFKAILPTIGRLFSKHHSAYTYLPKSVDNFPSRADFLAELTAAGYTHCSYRELSFGIVCLYEARK